MHDPASLWRRLKEGSNHDEKANQEGVRRHRTGGRSGSIVAHPGRNGTSNTGRGARVGARFERRFSSENIQQFASGFASTDLASKQGDRSLCIFFWCLNPRHVPNASDNFTSIRRKPNGTELRHTSNAASTCVGCLVIASPNHSGPSLGVYSRYTRTSSVSSVERCGTS